MVLPAASARRPVSVADLNQPRFLLRIVKLLFGLVLGVGFDVVRTAFKLLRQLFNDGVARLFARRIATDRDLHLVLAGVILVIDLGMFGHARGLRRTTAVKKARQSCRA